jgi:1,4-alpha-glucan branching enzyme
MSKPVNFFCNAPNAKQVFISGDFNDWDAHATPMKRQPDGYWSVQVSLHHGHHKYHFIVDGHATLDPRAQGIARDGKHHRVSVIAVS